MHFSPSCFPPLKFVSVQPVLAKWRSSIYDAGAALVGKKKEANLYSADTTVGEK